MLLLHAGGVGVRRLDDQPRLGAEVRIRAEAAVEDDHVRGRDEGVLLRGSALALCAADCLLGGVCRVVDDKRRLHAARADPCHYDDVAEFRDLAAGIFSVSSRSRCAGARPRAEGPCAGPSGSAQDFGPSALTCSTRRRASLSSASQEFSCSPTSRTHHARASLRLRATPASTSVSRTSRSGWRSLVMTGTENVVNITVRPPHVTPQETFRPNLCSASLAISIRCCRVSSRNLRLRPSAAAALSASVAPAATCGSVRTPSTVISSRSIVTSGGAVYQSPGSLPVNQPRSVSPAGVDAFSSVLM